MKSLNYLWRGLLMEKIKVSGTLVLGLAFFAPAFVVLVAFVAAYADGGKFYKPGMNPWINFSGHILVGWALFVFPIYVSLQSALYAAIEHQNRTFAYLYSLPVPRWSFYVSKLLVLTALTGLSHIVLYGSAEAAGWLLGLLKPNYGFQSHSMHQVLSKATLLMFFGGGGIMVIQLFISLQSASFIVPAGFGLFATMAGVISRGFAISTASPYLWPICFLNNSLEMADWRYSYLLISVAVLVLGAVVSIQLLNRKAIV